MSRKRSNRKDSVNLRNKVLNNLSSFEIGEWKVGNEVIATQKQVNLFSKVNLNNIRQKKHALDIIKKCKMDKKEKLSKNLPLSILRASIALGCPCLDKVLASKICNDGINVNFSHDAIDRGYYLKQLKLKNRLELSSLGLKSILDGNNSIFENFKQSKRRKSPVISTVFRAIYHSFCFIFFSIFFDYFCLFFLFFG